MASIVIKDLKENIELDQLAMRTITGGRSGLFRNALGSRSRTYNPISFSRLRLISRTTGTQGGPG